MAHVAKYTRSQVGGLSRHFERAKNENGEYLQFGNQEIDLNQTHMNYNLAPDQNQLDFIAQRCGEVQCLNRKDVNVMCSWVVTMPKGLHPFEDKAFFNAAYGFLCDRYGGEKNVISAYVHVDETTPHMHFAFVPVVMDEKKGAEKVSAKEVLHRQDLQTFHPDLDSYMMGVFGRDIGILNEATKEGNKSIAELKRETARDEFAELTLEVGELRNERDTLHARIDDLQALYGDKKKSLVLAHETQENALRGEIEAIQRQIEGLEEKAKVLTAAEVEAIKGQKNLVGGLKGVTYKEFESLKVTAAKVDEMEKAMNKAISRAKQADGLVDTIKQRADEQIKKAYADASSQLAEKKQQWERDTPSMAMRMENAKLRNENKELQGAMQRLPPEVRTQILPTQARAKGLER